MNKRRYLIIIICFVLTHVVFGQRIAELPQLIDNGKKIKSCTIFLNDTTGFSTYQFDLKGNIVRAKYEQNNTEYTFGYDNRDSLRLTFINHFDTHYLLKYYFYTDSLAYQISESFNDDGFQRDSSKISITSPDSAVWSKDKKQLTEFWNSIPQLRLFKGQDNEKFKLEFRFSNDKCLESLKIFKNNKLLYDFQYRFEYFN